MIATAKKSTVARKATPANDPRFKKGWGNKKGFWYLFIDGKKVSLARFGAPSTCTGKNGSRIERQQARDARDLYLATLEAKQAKPQQEPKKELTVADVFAPYITKHLPTIKGKDQMGRIIEKFLNGREHKVQGCEPFDGLGQKKWSSLTIADFDQWEASHPQWSQNTKVINYRTISAAINYAMKPAGGKLIDENPIAGMELKQETNQREKFKDGEDEIFRKYAPPTMLSLFDALWATGCRPMELGKSTTAHVEQNQQGRLVIRLAPPDWKNGVKTGKDRVIALPAHIEKHVAAVMADAEKQGKVLQLWPTSMGTAFNSKTLSSAFKDVVKAAVKNKEKINPNLTSYSPRHTFITRCVNKGIPSFKVAMMCGTSVAMIEKNYYHPSSQHRESIEIVDMMA